MKGYAKIRLAVFLCIMLVLPSILSVLPMTTQEATAAQDISMNWYYDFIRSDGSAIQIEKGTQFYIGDYATIMDGDKIGTASMFSDAKYISGKSSVIKINSKGLLTAKKTGTTTVKIKYKGLKISCKMKVVKKGAFSKNSYAKALQKATDKAFSSLPSKITKSNALKYTKISNNYSASAGKLAEGIISSGFLREVIVDGNYSNIVTSNKLAVPDAGRKNYLTYLLYRYSEKNSPTSTRSGKAMKISSVSVNTKQMTIKLKKAITADQILAANIENTTHNPKPNKNSATIYIYISDTKNDESYTALGTITKGSKVMKVKLYKWETVGSEWKFKAHKFKKGHTYKIGEKNISWGDGQTVICE